MSNRTGLVAVVRRVQDGEDWKDWLECGHCVRYRFTHNKAKAPFRTLRRCPVCEAKAPARRRGRVPIPLPSYAALQGELARDGVIAVAKRLRVSRQTLWRHIKKHLHPEMTNATV